MSFNFIRDAVVVALAVVVISILATVLGGASILGAAALGSFTGFVSIAVLVPLILVALVIVRVWKRGDKG